MGIGVEERRDGGAWRSRISLKKDIEEKMVRTMVAGLQAAEMIWGEDSEEIVRFRKYFKKKANENIRHMKNVVDGFNVERIRESHTINMEMVKGEGNGN